MADPVVVVQDLQVLLRVEIQVGRRAQQRPQQLPELLMPVVAQVEQRQATFLQPQAQQTLEAVAPDLVEAMFNPVEGGASEVQVDQES